MSFVRFCVAFVVLGVTLFFQAGLSAAEKFDVSGLFKDNEIWNFDSKNFPEKDMKKVFKWNSEDKQTARGPAYANSPEMDFLGLNVVECLVRFAGDKPATTDIVLYSRGDAGDMPQKVFLKTLGKINKRLTKWAGCKGSRINKDKVMRSRVMFRSWDSDKGEIVLKWSYSGHSKKSFRAEYIKVEITSPLEGAEGAATKVTGAKPEENPEDNVVEDKDGDIFVDNVPMVDQGQKGYCLVAVMERILRYYNKDVDQHQIAQVMNSSGSRGTKISEMNKTIRSVGTQLRIRQRDIYENKLIDVDFENYDIRNFSRMLDYVKKYNRYARKGGYEKVDIDKYIVKKGGAKTYYFGDMLKAMTPEGFRYWRVNGEARDYKRAFDKMKKYIKEGIPVCWLVTLGLVEEEKLTPQARGGHARLIIGFNDKEKKVIYTDTWGGEHTFKKMPYDDAWLITNAMYALTPRD